ncbi:MAG: hypothetical protein ACRELX_12195 [Longimicrobiales bacterium]
MRMFNVLKRFGFPLSRAFALLVVLAGIGVVAAFWIGPLQPVPPELRLLALGDDGRFTATPTLRLAIGDSAGMQPGNARFPLRLAVRNVGARAAAPVVLSLSIPARYRLTDGEHVPLRGQRTPNNPLVRYRIGLLPATIEPADAPTLLTTADTLWLEPLLPRYYCALAGDGVPEFIAAPVYDAARLARIAVFYSFGGGRRSVRQTGLIELRVDSTLVVREPAPTPPSFPVTLAEPAASLPELGPLARGGFRAAECGDPMQPIELQSVLWLTESGGRFIILYHGGVPRKYLFDLDADDVVELEMWDPDGDGDFEAKRQARFALPDYLLPPPSPADTLTVDSVWLANFHNVAEGPFRFLPDSFRPAAAVPAPSPPPPARPDSARVPPARPQPRPDTVRRDTAGRPAARDPVRRDTLRRDTSRIPAPPDTTSAFLHAETGS